MRGKLPWFARRLRAMRIIPAHAGQTRVRTGRKSRDPDHPRTCGANVRYDNELNQVSGSSPHMRGKRRWVSERSWCLRIIPAHAGQTTGPSNRPGARTDHPRTCGANLLGSLKVRHEGGSSPHMRGKQMRCCPGHVVLRIIPAHAGQTIDDFRRYATSADHPRTCGANALTCGTWK